MAVEAGEGVFLDGVVDEGPVDEVVGVEDGEAGEAGEGGGGEVEVVADAEDVGVRVVGEEDGIFVGVVVEVGGVEGGWRGARGGEEEGEGEEEGAGVWERLHLRAVVDGGL